MDGRQGFAGRVLLARGTSKEVTLPATTARRDRSVERRQLPYIKLGQAVRFHPDQVLAWLRQHAVPAFSCRDVR